ncbi:SMI1/KNR4 family protein [Kitasatospora sp. NPDC096140]|uniref:SMI1/KNR4 family protein n=1 Tax=Kitasatospora sp. NPDC096140 TaxID=3155425 RepID=UPI003324FEED
MDYLSEVRQMMGDPIRPRLEGEWGDVEAAAGVGLPDDYKTFIELYGPVGVNRHLTFHHPNSEMWSLARWIRETIDSYRGVEWAEVLEEPEKADQLAFGGPEGLVPLLASGRGEVLFMETPPEEEGYRLVVFVGDDCEFFRYDIGFAEWLFRYLVGEDMMGPNSSALPSGPLLIEEFPKEFGGHPEFRHGPHRGV